jgi:sRNA-binding carbon storage regulator CsrA
MLVLTRNVDETIVIGSLVEIRIIAIHEHGIHLAIRFRQKDVPVLTMTLKMQQTVHIGDQIVVVAVSTRSNHARIGITAPPGLPIFRGETEPPDDKTVMQDDLGEPDGQEAE